MVCAEPLFICEGVHETVLSPLEISLPWQCQYTGPYNTDVGWTCHTSAESPLPHWILQTLADGVWTESRSMEMGLPSGNSFSGFPSAICFRSATMLRPCSS